MISCVPFGHARCHLHVCPTASQCAHLRRRAHRGAPGHTAPPRPDQERGSSDPMCRPPLDAGHRRTGCLDGQSVRSQPLPQDGVERSAVGSSAPIPFRSVHQSTNQDGRASWPRRQIYSCPQHSHCRAQIQCGASCSTVLTASLLRAFRSGPSWTISRTDAAHEVGHGVANLVGAILLEEMAPFHRHFGLVQPGALQSS